MAKYKFKKFDHENVRTEFKAFDGTFKAPATVLKSRTAVAAASDTKIIAETTITASGAYLLAEDVGPNDQGIVYWIINDKANLEVE